MKREIEEQIYIIKVGNLYVINAYENRYTLNLAHASIFTKEEQTETANDFEVETILES